MDTWIQSILAVYRYLDTESSISIFGYQDAVNFSIFRYLDIENIIILF